ncbi:MAG: hypothetical protein EBQ96_00015 [Proteobacteria bacterium]|nr:hypothetical protein [Pseudomonadota bacterium]
MTGSVPPPLTYRSPEGDPPSNVTGTTRTGAITSDGDSMAENNRMMMTGVAATAGYLALLAVAGFVAGEAAVLGGIIAAPILLVAAAVAICKRDNHRDGPYVEPPGLDPDKLDKAADVAGVIKWGALLTGNPGSALMAMVAEIGFKGNARRERELDQAEGRPAAKTARQDLGAPS